MPNPTWERHEHGDRCRRGLHLEYRVRKPSWVSIHCKLCYWEDVELYEDSPLEMREEVAA
jgi:hypothetical protein